MHISGPTNPFHIARAYHVQPTQPLRQPQQTGQIERAGATTPSSFPLDVRHSTNIARLVAARAPGGIDFSGDTPRPSASTLPMYRHPADRNAAATALQAGRMLDIEG